MAKPYTRSTAITAELAARHLGRYDKNGTRASIGGSARGGHVEHRVQRIERDELVKSIDQRRLGTARLQRDAAEAIVINNGCVRQVARRRGANAIVKTPRQSATLWFGSVAVDTIERLAAARRTIRTRMIQQKGGQERRRQRVSWRRSQRWDWSNRIAKQNLGSSGGPLSGSTILWRTKPIDGHLPLSRKE